jgi:hypothetical protein
MMIRPMWIAELGISRVCRGASNNRWRVRLGQERAGGLQQWECVSFQRRFLRASLMFGPSATFHSTAWPQPQVNARLENGAPNTPQTQTAIPAKAIPPGGRMRRPLKAPK